jgi:hypothetical protein
MKMARARTHWFRDFVSDVGVAGDGETLRVGFAVGSLFPFRERWPGTSEGFGQYGRSTWTVAGKMDMYCVCRPYLRVQVSRRGKLVDS